MGPVGVAALVAESGLLGTAIGDGEGERPTCCRTGKLVSRARGCVTALAIAETSARQRSSKSEGR